MGVGAAEAGIAIARTAPVRGQELDHRQLQGLCLGDGVGRLRTQAVVVVGRQGDGDQDGRHDQQDHHQRRPQRPQAGQARGATGTGEVATGAQALHAGGVDDRHHTQRPAAQQGGQDRPGQMGRHVLGRSRHCAAGGGDRCGGREGRGQPGGLRQFAGFGQWPPLGVALAPDQGAGSDYPTGGQGLHFGGRKRPAVLAIGRRVVPLVHVCPPGSGGHVTACPPERGSRLAPAPLERLTVAAVQCTGSGSSPNIWVSIHA